MIVAGLPPDCPRCHAPLTVDRGEMAALRLGSDGLDTPLPYQVFLCAHGHTVQIGAPLPLREPLPSEIHRLACRACGVWFRGRVTRVYCSKACADRHKQRPPKPRTGPRRRPAYKGPPVPRPSPRAPQLPYASKRGAWRD